MSNDRSVRTLLAAFFLVAAVLIAASHLISSVPPVDWILPLALFAIGLALVFLDRFLPGELEFEDQAVTAADMGAAEALVAPEAVGALEAAAVTVIAPEPDAATTAVAEAPVAAEAAVEVAEPEVSVEPSEAPESPAQEAVVSDDVPGPAAEMPEQPVEAPEVAETEPGVVEPEVQQAVESTHYTVDNLELIDGIGPKIAAALKAAGIDTFEKLSAASESDLLGILEAASVRAISGVSSWAEQAQFAFRGDWAGLDKFNDARKGRTGD